MTAQTIDSDRGGRTLAPAPDLATIAGAIWDAMLGLDLAPASGLAIRGESLTGCVQLTGPWEGAVTVQLGTDLARRATALMLGVETADVEEADVTDAVGELANMAAGNVKGGLGAEHHLSLPSVTWGTDYRLSVPGSTVLQHSELACEGEPVIVALLGRCPRAGAGRPGDATTGSTERGRP